MRSTRAIVLLGALGSLFLMFRVGSAQKSIFLIVCFTGWVLLPYVALYLLSSDRWPERARFPLVLTAALVTLLALATYAWPAFGPRGPQPAKYFLVVPVVSLAAIGAGALWARKLAATESGS